MVWDILKLHITSSHPQHLLRSVATFCAGARSSAPAWVVKQTAPDSGAKDVIPKRHEMNAASGVMWSSCWPNLAPFIVLLLWEWLKVPKLGPEQLCIFLWCLKALALVCQVWSVWSTDLQTPKPWHSPVQWLVGGWFQRELRILDASLDAMIHWFTAVSSTHDHEGGHFPLPLFPAGPGRNLPSSVQPRGGVAADRGHGKFNQHLDIFV